LDFLLIGASLLSFALGVLAGGLWMKRRYAYRLHVPLSALPSDAFASELSDAATRVSRGEKGNVGHVLGRQTLRRYAHIINGTARESQDQ
jgi:hypothetical protein